MSMKQLFGAVTACALAVAGVAGVARSDDKSVNDEGFILTWLILAPIPLADGQEPSAAIDKEQIKGEAQLAPKDGDKVKVGDKELTWKKQTTTDYFFDVNKLLGAETNRGMAYAVAYVVAPDDIKGAALKIGSDDGCKVFVNGKEVGKAAEDRAIDKDQNTFENITLKKGVNVIVFKVVNNEGEWQGAARFVDKDGKPLAGLKAQLTK
jgi:hypothetical protein